MQPYRNDGYIFAFAAATAALVALAQPVILGRPDLLLKSAAGIELIGVPTIQALVGGICAVLLLRSNPLSRRAHLILACFCVIVAVAILLRGWGIFAVFLAAPTLSWAYHLRKVGA